MDITANKTDLEWIYRRYEADVAEFKRGAFCKSGCAYCCTHYGAVDMTTLEGLVIFDWMALRPRPLRVKLAKKLARNRRAKERGQAPRCPFLLANDTCRIYPVRPFSCRQLYSLAPCAGKGPTVHRRAVERVRAAVCELQALDDTGYSGHLSYILHMLDSADFRRLYLSGGFDPAAVMAFGKSHGIVINRLKTADAGTL